MVRRVINGVLAFHITQQHLLNTPLATSFFAKLSFLQLLYFSLNIALPLPHNAVGYSLTSGSHCLCLMYDNFVHFYLSPQLNAKDFFLSHFIFIQSTFMFYCYMWGIVWKTLKVLEWKNGKYVQANINFKKQLKLLF